MFNRKAIQQNRLIQLQAAVEGNVTELEKDLETALAITDAGEKFLALKRLDKKTESALTQINKNLKKSNDKAEILETLTSAVILFGGGMTCIVGTMMGIIPLGVIGIITLAGGMGVMMNRASLGDVFLYKNIIKKGEVIAEALNPAVNRLKNLQSKTNTVKNHMYKNDGLAICQSGAFFETLKAEFPDVRNSFAKAIEQDNKEKLSLGTSTPTMLDKGQSTGVIVKRQHKG